MFKCPAIYRCPVIDYLSAGHVKDLTAEELPGILWVVGERDDVDVSLSVVRD